MTEQGAQYDHIGSKYDAYARTATLKRAERYTFFRMVGALHGQRVLDLACGFGFYTPLLKQEGAATVGCHHPGRHGRATPDGLLCGTSEAPGRPGRCPMPPASAL